MCLWLLGLFCMKCLGKISDLNALRELMLNYIMSSHKKATRVVCS